MFISEVQEYSLALTHLAMLMYINMARCVSAKLYILLSLLPRHPDSIKDFLMFSCIAKSVYGNKMAST